METTLRSIPVLDADGSTVPGLFSRIQATDDTFGFEGVCPVCEGEKSILLTCPCVFKDGHPGSPDPFCEQCFGTGEREATCPQCGTLELLAPREQDLARDIARLMWEHGR